MGEGWPLHRDQGLKDTDPQGPTAQKAGQVKKKHVVLLFASTQARILSLPSPTLTGLARGGRGTGNHLLSQSHVLMRQAEIRTE